MMTKTEWLDWLESSTDRLQERYREAWTRLPRRARRAQNDNLEPDSKPWCAIQHEIDREPREVVVHLELPAPHTVEADVRVIGSTLAIAVLRTGTNISRAPTEDCYRRAIPLPPRVDPGSAVHKIHGDELVIRMQPETAAQQARPARASVATRRRRAAAEADIGEAVPAQEAVTELEPEDAMGDITVSESTAAEPSAEAGPVEERAQGAMTGDDDASPGDASLADEASSTDGPAGEGPADEKAAASAARRTKSTPRKAAASGRKAGSRTRKAPADGTKAAARRPKRTTTA